MPHVDLSRAREPRGVAARTEPVQRASRAPSVPVAEVVVDTGLAHLDHPFEYAVPVALTDSVQPGVRVRVPFAGRDRDGFVVARHAAATHPGKLAQIRRVVSAEPVLLPHTLALCRAVADRYAGSLTDVLRLAVPKRHAAAERALPVEAPALETVAAPELGPWEAYPAGPAFLRRLAVGEAPAAVWEALPGQPPDLDWPAALAVAASTAVAAGRGAVIVLPDHRDLDRLDAELTARLGRRRHVRLTADQGPQARYTAWLKVLRGHVRCVIGSRAAAFAPVRELGLVAWWDDADDLHDEPRSPYPHVREILGQRAQQESAALLAGGFTRSVALQQWVQDDRAAEIRPATATARASRPRVVVAGEATGATTDSAAAHARLAPQAWRAAARGLERGPVLVQVPRGGYLPTLSCQSCRSPVRCPRCHGPVGLGSTGVSLGCRWCATLFRERELECPQCGDRRVRSSVVGATRTAEELGRAFPGVPVLTSSGDQVLAQVGEDPALVIATPGAEPPAAHGYTAALLLDAWALLDRPVLDAQIETLRRWLAAASLVRPGAEGGVVVVAGVPVGPRPPAVEALARWDPVWLAARELSERKDLGLPPAVVMARLVGERRVVAAAVDDASRQLHERGVELVHYGPTLVTAGATHPSQPTRSPNPSGPAGLRDTSSAGTDAGHPRLGQPEAPAPVASVLRVSCHEAGELAAALRTVAAQRSARKAPGPLQIRLHWPG
ncbi:MAG: primosome assembly protein PriA [Actinomycetales bacterium]|nr:MAG: primosome assembly protein PriA [Actinomycetales bacterium]